jgi:Arc/MetJ-type ribon-helix-helix transcriptional regulator
MMYHGYTGQWYKLSGTPKWTSVAFPSEMVEAIRELIKELKYWPSVSTFCREAVREKLEKERELLKELRAERQKPSVNEDPMKGRKRRN